jgi:putative ABC transport system permease protein
MGERGDIPRPAPWLGRLLPARVRRDVFEPAAHDLQVEAGLRRLGRRRLLLLYLDCWRVTLFPARQIFTARLPRSHRSVSLKGQVNHMWQDIRYAMRRLVHERAFTAAAVLTLTLGVGANVAVFAVVEAVLLRPLPYVDADRLVILNHRDDRTGISKEFIAIGDFVDLAARQTTLDGLAAFNRGRATIYGDSDPILAPLLGAGPGFLDLLEVQPAHGRFFNANDTRQGAAPVVVLGHALWLRSYGGNLDIVGRRIRMGTLEREVVGIAPPGFTFPANEKTDVIIPYPIPTAAPAERKGQWLFAVGRLSHPRGEGREGSEGREGVNVQLSSLSEQFEREHPAQNQGSRYYVTSLRDSLVGDTKRPLTMLAFAVGAVLLIACANVGNLLLVRALGRQQEMAVRAALGASRTRMTGQVLAESLVLALVSAVGGVALAYWGTPALVALVPDSVNAPGLSDAGLNLNVLGFALAISVGAALIFGLVSAITSNRPAAAALASPGRAGVSRHVRRLTSSLVIVEVALAVMLLLGAGLILRSFAGLMSVDPGFNADRVVAFDIQLPAGRYPDFPARALFYQRAMASASAVRAVEAVGTAAVVPLTGNNWTAPFERLDQPMTPGERPPDVGWQAASGGYFKALSIPLKSGRLFDERDRPGSAPVVIVSEAIERRFFAAGESAVGHFVKTGTNQTAEIIGVVGDIRRAALTDEPRADMYFPFERQPGNAITVFARTAGDPNEALPALRDAFRTVEPKVMILNNTTLAETAARSVGTTRLVLWLLGLFAAIALALAGVGIYGVLAHAVRQRTREIGTRLALGARPLDILWLVMRWGAVLAAAGVILGGAAGLVAAQSLKSMLYGVTTTDPRVLAGAGATLFLTALAASVIPARRASRTDPARTLGV